MCFRALKLWTVLEPVGPEKRPKWDLSEPPLWQGQKIIISDLSQGPVTPALVYENCSTLLCYQGKQESQPARSFVAPISNEAGKTALEMKITASLYI